MTGSAEYQWALTDHVCSACLGRVLERKPAEGPREFRCSNCGATGNSRQGLTHPPICACSTKVGKRDAGVRCIPNPRPRPELPSEILAREIG